MAELIAPIGLMPVRVSRAVSHIAHDMGRLGKALLLAGFITYPVLLHSFILKEQVEMWQLIFVFAPMLGVAGWVLFRMLDRAWWPLLLIAMAALVYFIVSGDHGRIGLLAVNGLSHATLNLFLLWLFGRTLLRGQESLISQISRLIHGELQPDTAIYTRQVTVAWCTFFALQVVISLSLYVFAPTAAWSLFINVLNLPLLILMFLVEHAYRKVRIPSHPRTSILKAIEVYSKNFAAPKKADN